MDIDKTIADRCDVAGVDLRRHFFALHSDTSGKPDSFLDTNKGKVEAQRTEYKQRLNIMPEVVVSTMLEYT